jgi:hypothetical protein
MRIVISWFSDNCIFQATYKQEELPVAKKLFYDQLGRFYDVAWLDILWKNIEYEFSPQNIAEYGPNHSFTERILSTFMVTYLT